MTALIQCTRPCVGFWPWTPPGTGIAGIPPDEFVVEIGDVTELGDALAACEPLLFVEPELLLLTFVLLLLFSDDELLLFKLVDSLPQ